MANRAFERALEKLRRICQSLPEMHEVEAWGHPTFRAGKKLFAAFGQHDGEMSIGLRVGFERQAILLEDERFFPTPYAARLGWVSLRVDEKTDWSEVSELVRVAYRGVALKRMLAQL